MRLFVAPPLRRSCVTLLLPALAHAFLPVLPLRTLSGPSRGALPRATRSGSLNVVMDAEPNFPEDAYQQVFVAEFIHVRKSLNTLLKLWLMGKPDGAKGWSGTGELEAKPVSSVKSAAVECDSSAPSPCLRGPRARFLVALRTLYQPLRRAPATLRPLGRPEVADPVAWLTLALTVTRHTSGTLASIIVEDELGKVSLLSSSPPSYNNNVQLTRCALTGAL